MHEAILLIIRRSWVRAPPAPHTVTCRNVRLAPAGSAMAGLPEGIGLLYRADWTRLSLSAEVRSETDRNLLPPLSPDEPSRWYRPRPAQTQEEEWSRWHRAWPAQQQD